MKKLEVTKILVLAAISVGLVSCGQVSSDHSVDADSQNEASLKGKVPGKKSPLDEGGGNFAAPIDPSAEEGGGNMAALTDDGSARISNEEDGQVTVDLDGTLLMIEGNSKESIMVVLNGREKLEVLPNADGSLEFMIELADEDLNFFNLQIVMSEAVMNYVVTEGAVKEILFE
jgi:hypothetical protein